MEKYVNELLIVLNKNWYTVAIKRKINYGDLITSILNTTSIVELAEVTNISKYTLGDNLKKIFIGKDKKSSWHTYLFGLLEVKVCNKCLTIKSFSEYQKDTHTFLGLSTSCKICERSRVKTYYYNNLDKMKLKGIYYRSINKEKYKLNNNVYRLAHMHEFNARTAKYRASKLLRTPSWSNLELIKLFYINCPKGFHVDHIIPLQGVLVSGLHVLSNLQYLSKFKNLSKGNKFDIEKDQPMFILGSI